jgi:hypothetical protein
MILLLGNVNAPIKGVPRALFDHLFSVATLPMIFEGRGTLNLALNTGRPFLHLISGEYQLSSKEATLRHTVFPTFCVSEGLVHCAQEAHFASFALQVDPDRATSGDLHAMLGEFLVAPWALTIHGFGIRMTAVRKGASFPRQSYKRSYRPGSARNGSPVPRRRSASGGNETYTFSRA